MNLEDINKVKIPRKKRKRVGRGSGSGNGKTSGRGQGGQGTRSGNSRMVGFEGGQMSIIRRMPKRGFNNFMRKEFAVLNVSSLEQFEDGAVIGPEEMSQAGLINGKYDAVKVLGTGELTKKLTVRANRFSKTAIEKIEAAGGTVEAK